MCRIYFHRSILLLHLFYIVDYCKFYLSVFAIKISGFAKSQSTEICLGLTRCVNRVNAVRWFVASCSEAHVAGLLWAHREDLCLTGVSRPRGLFLLVCGPFVFLYVFVSVVTFLF
jgi:hypothetical protein